MKGGGANMAQFVFTKAQLVVEYVAGTNEKGENVFKTKTFANIRESVTADQLLAISNAFDVLSNYPVSATYKVTRNAVL